MLTTPAPLNIHNFHTASLPIIIIVVVVVVDVDVAAALVVVAVIDKLLLLHMLVSLNCRHCRSFVSLSSISSPSPCVAHRRTIPVSVAS